MKNISLTSLLCLCTMLWYTSARAQYCGGSGPTICAANQSFTTVGFDPPQDNLPCIVEGVPYDTVIQFHAPPQALGYNIQKIKVNSITNLPLGMCWAMGDANNTVNGNSTGCIRVRGTTNDAPGQYLVKVYADVTVVLFGTTTYTVSNVYVDSVAGLKYFLRVKAPNCTCANVDTLATGNTATAAVGTINPPTIGGGSTICNGAGVTLTVTGGNYYAYNWSNGTCASTTSVTNAGTYTVTVYGSGTSATATKTITTGVTPTAAITPSPDTVCAGIASTITASGGGTYAWNVGATTAGITISPANPTTYTVTVTSASGCTATASLNVVTASPPSVSISPGSASVCSGQSTALTASGASTYLWSTAETTALVNVSPGSSTTYTVTGTDTHGCSATASRLVSVTTVAPTITANGPTSFCAGGSVTLSITGSYTGYSWSSGETTSSIVVTTGGTYTASVTATGGCTGTSNTITVTSGSNLTPAINASNGFNICSGGSTILNAGSGYDSYVWSNAATTETITANPGSTTVYTVTVTQGACTGSASASVNVGNFPVSVSVLPESVNACADAAPFTLDGGAGFASYLWSNGATTQTLDVNASGDYILNVTQNNGCTGADTVPVSITPVPSPTITPSAAQNICPGQTVTLDAGAYDSYLWSSGETTRTITVGVTGSFDATVTVNGCTGASANAVSVTLNQNPAPSINPSSNQTICDGAHVTLSADAAYDSYQWSNAATTQSIDVTATGTYSLTVTQNGCSGTVTGPAVTVNAVPNATITSLGTVGGYTALQASPAGATYEWLYQQTPGSAYIHTPKTTQTDTVFCSGTAAYYSVVVTQNGCLDTSSAATVLCSAIDQVPSLVNFGIQPNPANDVLNITYELNGQTAVNLVITDVSGRRVMDVLNQTQLMGVYRQQLHIAGLAPGIYLLNFITSRGQFNTRFIKQ